jgi:hypothetical protein
MSDSEDESKEISLKFVLVGDGSTGKVTNICFFLTLERQKFF